jgi:predicted ester cyclase/heme-degrading monooxygenase HmoA
MKSIRTAHLVSAFLLIAGLTYAQTKNENSKNKEVTMNIEQRNKEVVRRIYEESLNKRNTALLAELVSSEFTGIRGIKGAAGMEAALAPLVQAFPDIQWKIEELIAEGNKVVVKWKWLGTSKGPYQRLVATEKTISNEAVAIYELTGGKVTGVYMLTDRLGFMQQMEAVPQDLTLFTNRKANADQVRFIDKFMVPMKAKEAFMERVKINRNFIKTLPGFIEDHAYERADENGNLIFITIAVWENEEFVKKAKEVVQAEYKRQGFNMPKFLEQLQITMDRGLYKEGMQ